MALFTSEKLGTEIGEAFHHPTDRCFYCGDPLTGDVWSYWSGIDERGIQIWMHPACAKRLADHLNKDWEKFKRLHPEKLWNPNSSTT